MVSSKLAKKQVISNAATILTPLSQADARAKVFIHPNLHAQK